ncbi:ComE operon protein 1 [Pirellula sp. SH-Sr6A]|uniref:ComEA family DNA-binding protein n=1 Tax=Pirellula sp. SH-Sr6A TaxID=1632865 RepID=UPI00078C922A|nr:helix-hairpin-helix domain-containing protein [Pirellula sp. SH-Sr6A]AMV31210.1 ComE operon protein 1 [Pirellula sp. SH-Sr6A]
MNAPTPTEATPTEKHADAPTLTVYPRPLARATVSIAMGMLLCIPWMIYVEWRDRRKEANSLSSAPFVVDLNLATESELNLLPGVGPKLAKEILRLRDERGKFERVEDLLAVPGIKQTRLDQIRPYVVVP